MTNGVNDRNMGTEELDPYLLAVLRHIGMSVEQYKREEYSNPILAGILHEQARQFRNQDPEGLILKKALPSPGQKTEEDLLAKAEGLNKQIQEMEAKFVVDVPIPQASAVKPRDKVETAPDETPAEVAEMALAVRLDTLNTVLAKAIKQKIEQKKIELPKISRGATLRIFGNAFDAEVDVAVSVPRIEPVPNDGGRFAVVIPLQRGTLKVPGIELDFSGAEVVATFPIGAVQIELVWGEDDTIQPVVRLNKSGLKVPVTLRNVPDKAKVISELLKIANELVEKMTAALFVPDIRLPPFTPFTPKGGETNEAKKKLENDRQAFRNFVRVARTALPTLVRLGFVGSGRDPKSAKVVLRVLMSGRYAADLSGSDDSLLANNAAVLTVGGEALVNCLMRPLLSAALKSVVKGDKEQDDLSLSYAPFRVDIKQPKALDSDKLAQQFLEDTLGTSLFRRFVAVSIDRLSLSVTGSQVTLSAALTFSVEYLVQVCSVRIDLDAAYELNVVEKNGNQYVCFDKKQWKCSFQNDTSLTSLILLSSKLGKMYLLLQALLSGGSTVANNFLDLSTFIPKEILLPSSVTETVRVGGITVGKNWHLAASPR
ncbi:MAG TPA: hypothetical protein VF815_23165 [Myxococcaceae bacterium]|jgi:hypothetical protein